jgi:hypothetical protein
MDALTHQFLELLSNPWASEEVNRQDAKDAKYFEISRWRPWRLGGFDIP